MGLSSPLVRLLKLSTLAAVESSTCSSAGSVTLAAWGRLLGIFEYFRGVLARFPLVPLTEGLVDDTGYSHVAGLKYCPQSSFEVLRGWSGEVGAVDEVPTGAALGGPCTPLVGALFVEACSCRGGGGGGGTGLLPVGEALELGTLLLACCGLEKYSFPLVNFPFHGEGEKLVFIDSELWLLTGVVPPKGILASFVGKLKLGDTESALLTKGSSPKPAL